ncbi:MAG: hypothetical protein ACLQLC_03210 [Candidatus Sulfotelmatobacter sp.]
MATTTRQENPTTHFEDRGGQQLTSFAMSVLTVAFLVSSYVIAQDTSNRPAEAQKGQVIVQGCVARLSGDYVLMQSDPGNTYVLHAARSVKLGKYLGQRVNVVGTKSPTLSDSSDSSKSTSSVTIVVNSISTVSRECKD